ncbi:MAG: alpha/beta hydrolase, partial [Gammaproteobacteria bacterium]|nr:alpha/beta hydrolase [Gammaproteobacteria bacterium]
RECLAAGFKVEKVGFLGVPDSDVDSNGTSERAHVGIIAVKPGHKEVCETRSSVLKVATVSSTDGVSISHYVRGSGTPALVFVHGGMCDHSYWDEQVAHFASRYTIVTLDLAGHGDSGIGREEWTMEAFGGDVAAVVNHLDLKRIILIGHGMGGPVIVEAASLVPDRIMGLVGVDVSDLEQKQMTPDQLE